MRGRFKAVSFSSIATIIIFAFSSASVPTDYFLETVSAQTIKAQVAQTISIDQIAGEYQVFLSPQVLADAAKDEVKSVTGKWIIKSNGTFENYLKAVSTKDEIQEIMTFGKITIENGKVISQVETVNGKKPDQIPPKQTYTLSADGYELQADGQPVKLVRYNHSPSAWSAASPQVATKPNLSSEEIKLAKMLEVALQQSKARQFTESLETLQKMLSIARTLKDIPNKNSILNTIKSLQSANLLQLALQQLQSNKFKESLATLEQALPITRELKDKHPEGIILNAIGLVYENLGQYTKALESYQQALEIHKKISDRSGEASSLNGIASVYANLGQQTQALETYKQSLAISKETGNHSSERMTLNGIGIVYQSLRQYEQAINFYQQALDSNKKDGSHLSEGNILSNIGSAYESLGQYFKALEYEQKALIIAQGLKDYHRVGIMISRIAGFLHLANNSDKPDKICFITNPNICVFNKSLYSGESGYGLDLSNEYSQQQLLAEIAVKYAQMGNIKEARHIAEALTLESEKKQALSSIESLSKRDKRTFAIIKITELQKRQVLDFAEILKTDNPKLVFVDEAKLRVAVTLAKFGLFEEGEQFAKTINIREQVFYIVALIGIADIYIELNKIELAQEKLAQAVKLTMSLECNVSPCSSLNRPQKPRL